MVFSWINAYLTLNWLAYIPQMQSFNIFDLYSQSCNVIAAAGIFGFAYYKPLINVVFWRYFFYAAIVDLIVNGVIVTLYEITRSEVEIRDYFFIEYIFWMIYGVMVLYAINQYAYKRAFIWQPKM